MRIYRTIHGAFTGDKFVRHDGKTYKAEVIWTDDFDPPLPSMTDKNIKWIEVDHFERYFAVTWVIPSGAEEELDDDQTASGDLRS